MVIIVPLFGSLPVPGRHNAGFITIAHKVKLLIPRDECYFQVRPSEAYRDPCCLDHSLSARMDE